MKNNYPYLRDPRALSEIRKHQWIESQKAGQEIGFGSAAIDWISRYGQAWEDAHVKKLNDRAIFLEQRKYRRYALESTVTLMHKNETLLVRSINVSSQGLLCKTSQRIDPGSKVVIRWAFGQTETRGLEFEGSVERISGDKDGRGEYLLLVKFSNGAREQIENFTFLIKR